MKHAVRKILFANAGLLSSVTAFAHGIFEADKTAMLEGDYEQFGNQVPNIWSFTNHARDGSAQEAFFSETSRVFFEICSRWFTSSS